MDAITKQLIIGAITGAACGGLIIRGSTFSDGQLLGLFQLFSALAIIVVGTGEIVDYPYRFGSGFVVLSGVLIVFLAPRLRFGKKTLKKESDFAEIFGRELGSVETKIVKLWVLKFGSKLFGKRKIIIAPDIQEEMFDGGEDKICKFTEDESVIAYLGSKEVKKHSGVEGILITTKGIYWRQYAEPERIKAQIRYCDINYSKTGIYDSKSFIFPKSIKIYHKEGGFNELDAAASFGYYDETGGFVQSIYTFIKEAAMISQSN